MYVGANSIMIPVILLVLLGVVVVIALPMRGATAIFSRELPDRGSRRGLRYRCPALGRPRALLLQLRGSRTPGAIAPG